jgi:hypothetical protein
MNTKYGWVEDLTRGHGSTKYYNNCCVIDDLAQRHLFAKLLIAAVILSALPTDISKHEWNKFLLVNYGVCSKCRV